AHLSSGRRAPAAVRPPKRVENACSPGAAAPGWQGRIRWPSTSGVASEPFCRNRGGPSNATSFFATVLVSCGANSFDDAFRDGYDPHSLLILGAVGCLLRTILDVVR